MKKELITRLLSEKKIVHFDNFKIGEYETDEGWSFTLIIRDGEEHYYATKEYQAEIHRALNFYISSFVSYHAYGYENELAMSFFLEPPILDRQQSFLYQALEELKGRIQRNSELGLSLDIKEESRLNLHSFVAMHFEDWITYWEQIGYIDFEQFDWIDMTEFNNPLDILLCLECVEHVKERIKLLVNGDNKENQQETSHSIEPTKLIWRGTPAHLAFIIDLLIEKGYLQKPTPYGERTAEILLSTFDFVDHKPTKESLGKLLHKDRYPISDQTVIDRFKRIPNRSELKR